MNKLLQKLIKAGSVTGASVMSDSMYFTEKDMVKTDLPILNIAFSGEVDGGFASGLTIISGESKTFKSMTALYCVKAYLDANPDGMCVFYDTEYGISLDAMKTIGVDSSRVLHVPVEHIEQLKFDFVKKLEEIKRGDKVFFLVDSIGQISSKKETDDAADEKSVADMTRAKSLRSLLRLITLQLVKKNLPCFMINHVYSEIGLFPKTIIPGGTAVTYSSDTVFVITKSQEKDGTELKGWNFNINIHKSRSVKEKSRLPIRVMYEEGIKQYSGILDLALESGDVIKPSNGWFSLVDTDTGEISPNKVRAKDTETSEFLGIVLKRPKFKEWVKNKFKLGAMQSTNNIDLDDEDTED